MIKRRLTAVSGAGARLAAALPMPPPPPVMSTTLFSNLISAQTPSLSFGSPNPWITVHRFAASQPMDQRKLAPRTGGWLSPRDRALLPQEVRYAAGAGHAGVNQETFGTDPVAG